MKKILILIVLAVSFSSCEDFLHEDPDGLISQEKFFNDQEDVERAVISVYKCLNSQGLYGRYWPAIDVGTDDVGAVHTAWSRAFSDHSLSSDQEWFIKSAVWDAWWAGVNSANFIITNVNKVPNINENYKTAVLGEMRCMRAFFYFNIARGWGDIPIIDHFVDNNSFNEVSAMKREKVMDVYTKLIIPDLVYAAESAPSEQLMKGRATKWLAKTILADVYATCAGYRRDSETGETVKGDDSYWQLARDVAWQVVNECPNKLITDKGSFTNAYARIWEENFSKESLLETGTISEAGNGSWITRECWSTFLPNPFWGPTPTSKPFGDNRTLQSMKFPGAPKVGAFIPCPDLYHAMEEGDLRKWGILTRYDEGAKTYICQPAFRKYVSFDVALKKLGSSFQYADRNFVIYRTADAFLLFAEADNEVNGPTTEAIDVINQIRNRAGLDNLTADKTSSQEAFRKAIQQERRIELHGECKRRFDLVRWNLMQEETRHMDILWKTTDNLNPVTGKSYMARDCKIINVPSTIIDGCQTITEAPALFNILPIPATEIRLTGWKNNKGY